jgi:hypothetical protein
MTSIEELEQRLAAHTEQNAAQNPEQALDDRDFAPGEEVVTDNPTPIPEDVPTVEYVPPVVGPGLEASAAGIVKGLSVLMGFFGRKFYAKAMLEPNDAQLVQSIQAQAEAAPPSKQDEVFNNLINANPEALGAYSRSLKFTEAIKGLPFTDEEQELLARPMGNLLGHYKVQPGPWGDLLIALMIIMLPRLEPLLPGTGKILASLADNE